MTDAQIAHLNKLRLSATHPSVPTDEQARAERRFRELYRIMSANDAFNNWSPQTARETSDYMSQKFRDER